MQRERSSDFMRSAHCEELREAALRTPLSRTRNWTSGGPGFFESCLWGALAALALVACGGSSDTQNGTSAAGGEGQGGSAGSVGGGGQPAGSTSQADESVTSVGGSVADTGNGGMATSVGNDGSSTEGVGGSATQGAGGSSTEGVGGSATQGAGGSMAGAGGDASDGGMGQPDEGCMQFCASNTIQCGGPDTEYAPTSAITATTPTGCSLSIMLAANGTVNVDIDCIAGQACVSESGGGCLGTPGQCYDGNFDGGFSYQLPDCITGGVWCAPQ